MSWAQPCAQALCLNGMISPAAPLPPPQNCTEKAPQIVLRMCGTTRPETRPLSASTASPGVGDRHVPVPSGPDMPWPTMKGDDPQSCQEGGGGCWVSSLPRLRRQSWGQALLEDTRCRGTAPLTVGGAHSGVRGASRDAPAEGSERRALSLRPPRALGARRWAGKTGEVHKNDAVTRFPPLLPRSPRERSARVHLSAGHVPALPRSVCGLCPAACRGSLCRGGCCVGLTACALPIAVCWCGAHPCASVVWVCVALRCHADASAVCGRAGPVHVHVSAPML